MTGSDRDLQSPGSELKGSTKDDVLIARLSASEKGEEGRDSWGLRLPPPATEESIDAALEIFPAMSSQCAKKRRATHLAGLYKLQSSFDLEFDEVATRQASSYHASPLLRAEYNEKIGAKYAKLFSGNERDWSCMEVGPTVCASSLNSLEHDP
jgi:hypothetical protein